MVTTTLAPLTADSPFTLYEAEGHQFHQFVLKQ
jgi:hypothetical protein